MDGSLFVCRGEKTKSQKGSVREEEGVRADDDDDRTGKGRREGQASREAGGGKGSDDIKVLKGPPQRDVVMTRGERGEVRRGNE